LLKRKFVPVGVECRIIELLWFDWSR